VKISFETTVFNRYFESGREHSAETKRLFEMIPHHKIAAYSSTAVLEEIDRAPSPSAAKCWA